MNHLRRLFFRLVSFFRSGRAEAELAREIDAHLQLLEDQFVAQGMSRGEARLAARRAFGGQVEQTKVRQRDVRSFRFLDESWLDLKLGARLLVKTPGLTVVAVFALSVAIAGGAAYMEFLRDLTRPTLPIRDGNRIVGIYNWDAARGEADHRSLHDFAVWRDALASVEEVGAYAVLERNLITDDGRAELVSGVEISPGAFRLMSTPPLLGRPLVEHDAQAGAAPVVVLGETLWEARFGRDPAVVGQTIRLGRERHTVVGVMPRSFGFPVNQNLWVPLRVTEADVRRGEGPSIRVFGRLGPGASLAEAQAEIQAVSTPNRTDAQSNQQVRPQIQPWVTSLWSSATDGQLQLVVLYSANLFFIALLGVCGANVATLVFGRTALRESEITVRTALGASRGRIIGQLFAEALVLAAVAAVVGIAGASFAVSWGTARWLEGTAGGAQAPFWLNDQLSPETLVYAGALALLAAIIVGVIPGLKATGPEMQARLKHAAAGGATMKFGGVWTGIIVGQVALTVLFLLSAVSLGWNLYAPGYQGGGVTYRAEDFLSVRLEPDAESRAALDGTYQELERRLLTEPGVAAVTYASAVPGTKHGEFFVELQDTPIALPTDVDPLSVRTASVADTFFETFDMAMVAGRAFTPADVAFDRTVAIVDERFVAQVLGGRNAIGQFVRDRELASDALDAPRGARPWYEIVGVVEDLSTLTGKTKEHAVLYRPAAPSATLPMLMVVRADGDAPALGARVRTLAGATDPTLRLHSVTTLDQVEEADRIAFQFFLRAIGIVSVVALVLSAAGVYALLSFAVVRRTREIGIRVAVGADRRRILSSIFSRAFAQVGLGIAAGSLPGVLLVAFGAPEVAGGSGPAVALAACAVVAMFMMGVALLACVVPARRALRIQPTDALRADA